ncbi:hypothetical protein [Roseofilum casamattae]|uniref:Uncharacterized protein n=1 Tax=Roseofilum casamattae BLCC-M143 TaxID=3022442 RepID=A0ABT7C1S1_9CYAN|nr:hypothetical protein [Roseofilum casamattae]MDJ1185396.1 hypothetical protein [Roseofilum casamattae BLCC-M143]
MNQETQHERNYARQEFEHSLHQLEETLKMGKIPNGETKNRNPLSTHQFQQPQTIDDQTLAEAAADIDEFMKHWDSDAP